MGRKTLLGRLEREGSLPDLPEFWVKSLWVKSMCRKSFWVKSLWVRKYMGEHTYVQEETFWVKSLWVRKYMGEKYCAGINSSG